MDVKARKPHTCVKFAKDKRPDCIPSPRPSKAEQQKPTRENEK